MKSRTHNHRVTSTATCVLATITILCSTSAHAQDVKPIPKEYVGIWAKRCGDLNSAVLRIESNQVTVEERGNRRVYGGVDFSYTYGEGARASGRYSWILVSKVPNGMYAFVLTVPGYGRAGPAVFEEGAAGEGREVRDLFGVKFRRCRQ